MNLDNLRWWGWGTLDRTYSLDDRPRFWPFLEARLGPIDVSLHPVLALADIALPPSRLTNTALAALRGTVGDEHLSTDTTDRLVHSFGKSYCDLIRLRRGLIDHPTDAVVYPADADQVADVLRVASAHRYAVVPFGGGTSVLGGVEPLTGPGQTGVITLDLRRLDHLLALDETSRLATAQAGTAGPVLEAALNARGFTLGHFPQSFEFSTLGGWIATRAAGQASTGYGKIEDMVVSLRVVTPSGEIVTRRVPASAAGPDLDQLLIGSEGVLGVITEATLRVHPQPAVQSYRGILFRQFEDGLAAIRSILQSELAPTVVRLSDPAETESFVALQRVPASRARRVRDWAAQRAIAGRGFSLHTGCVLILGFDGDGSQAWQKRRDAALALCRKAGGFNLGQGVGRTWLRERFDLPYLRDTLLDHGLMVDTLETATTWDNLEPLYHHVRSALQGAIESTGVQPWVMCHVSHVYLDGASLYYTFMAKQVPGHEIGQWQVIKHAATEAILAHGGTLSHHHGVGRDHAPWLVRELGKPGLAALRAVKQALDPAGVMNPGKIF
jgi:alkyldihydroxyacetonephosphate synthase